MLIHPEILREMRDWEGRWKEMNETKTVCPCDNATPVRPSYRLCETCLEIASANGIDINLYRE